MVVSSFFPGRIRLRHAVLKDEDISAALKSAVLSHNAVNRVEYNTHTGSALIEYEPDKLPLQKFKAFKTELATLQNLCDSYTKAKKNEILAAIQHLADKLNG